jgi:hypothetical protein
MALRNVSTHFEVIAKNRRAGTAPPTQLRGQIGEVFHLRRLPLSALGHSSGTAGGSAKDIPKDLPKDIAARHLRCLRAGRHWALWWTARHGHLARSTRFEAALLYTLLKLTHDGAEKVPASFSAILCGGWRRLPVRGGNLAAAVCRHAARSAHLASEYLSEDIAEGTA